MKVKIVKCSLSTYWYSDKIGKIYEVESEDETDYMVLPRHLHCNKLLLKKDCRPLKAAESRKRAPNSQMATALWKELNRRDRISHRMPEKTNWVPVTKQRLNTAVAALRH